MDIVCDGNGEIAVVDLLAAVNSKADKTSVGTYSIGVPGEIGFGVAPALEADYLAIGATPFEGHDSLYGSNRGKYLHVASGAVLYHIPKHYYRDIGNTTTFSDVPLDGYVLDRTFINGGVELNGVFTFAYEGSNNGGKLSSQKNAAPVSTSTGNNPIGNLNGTPPNRYGGIYMAAKSCDSAAYPVPFWHRRMLARLAVAHGKASTSTAVCAFTDVAPFHPKGNNNNALADHADTSVTFTSAGNATYPNCALTGSGVPFSKTTHNGQECGIADLNGNMWEAMSGLIYMARTGATGTTGTDAVALTAHGYEVGQAVAFGGTPSSGATYNTAVYEVATVVDADNFTLTTVLERDILATDGIYTGKTFYMLKESTDIRALADDSTTAGTGAFDLSLYDQIDLSDLFTSNGVWRKLGNAAEQVFEFSTDRNSDAYKRASLGMPRLAGSSAGGTTEYGNDGIYTYFRHECVPLSGGRWSSLSYAGVGAGSFHGYRTGSNDYVGVRASFVALA